jgi:hypothetical protein
VLTKTSALFERERTVRDVDLVDLRWLETIPLPRPERDDDQGGLPNGQGLMAFELGAPYPAQE